MSTETLIVAVAIPTLSILVGLFSAMLLHRREVRRLRDERDSRANEVAQRVIQSALEERGLERRIDGLSSRQDRHADELRDIHRQLADALQALPNTFVRRDDWIQHQSRMEGKLDKIWTEIHALIRQQLPPSQPTHT
ncbi:MAG: hypothetical protein AAF170_08530 [Bacteroidota bacterium]